MHTQPIWYAISAPIMVIGVMLISLGLFACCLLLVERRNPFEVAALTIPRIFAGAACFISMGALLEVIAVKLVY